MRKRPVAYISTSFPVPTPCCTWLSRGLLWRTDGRTRNGSRNSLPPSGRPTSGLAVASGIPVGSGEPPGDIFKARILTHIASGYLNRMSHAWTLPRRSPAWRRRILSGPQSCWPSQRRTVPEPRPPSAWRRATTGPTTISTPHR